MVRDGGELGLEVGDEGDLHVDVGLVFLNVVAVEIALAVGSGFGVLKLRPEMVRGILDFG